MVTTNGTVTGGQHVIKPDARFGFNCHKEFRDAYTQELPAGCLVVLDMSEVEYMDSSALGMLLIMREHLEKTGHKIAIRNCQDSILNVLKIANYEKLFDIS